MNIQETKTGSRDMCTPMFTAALFTQAAKIWKQPNAHQWMNEERDVASTYTIGYYSAMKMKNILPSVPTWMDLEKSVR